MLCCNTTKGARAFCRIFLKSARQARFGSGKLPDVHGWCKPPEQLLRGASHAAIAWAYNPYVQINGMRFGARTHGKGALDLIGILDYGIGNVGSIKNMLKKAGAGSTIVHTAEELSACDKLILPGVGAFDDGMERLDASGMRGALDEAVALGKPVLGICLGMQMLGTFQRGRQTRRAGVHPFPQPALPTGGLPRAQSAAHGLGFCQPCPTLPTRLCKE